jgi:hypothetical protein
MMMQQQFRGVMMTFRQKGKGDYLSAGLTWVASKADAWIWDSADLATHGRELVEQGFDADEITIEAW